MKPTKTYKIRSATDKKKIHYVHYFSDGKLVCTCKGYEFRNQCKHSKYIQNNYLKYVNDNNNNGKDTAGPDFK